MKYNVSKFNVDAVDTQEPPITMHCSEKIEIMVQTSTDISLDAIGIEQIMTKSIVSGASIVTFEYEESLDLESRYGVASYVEMNVEHELDVKSSIHETVYLTPEFNEEFDGDFYVSTNTRIYDNNFLEDVKINTLVGKSITMSGSGSESLWINSDSTILNEEISQINVTLRRGEKLTINSENFTVFLNETNVLDKYDGSWIEISRDTEKIILTSPGNSQIRGKIIYRERFL